MLHFDFSTKLRQTLYPSSIPKFSAHPQYIHFVLSPIQDLLNGIIEVNENALSENIEVKKVSEGAVTNVLPQKINAGEEIGTITIGGVVQKISAVEDLDLKAGSTLSVRLSRRIGGGIIDGNVPLYR